MNGGELGVLFFMTCFFGIWIFAWIMATSANGLSSLTNLPFDVTLGLASILVAVGGSVGISIFLEVLEGDTK